MGQGFLWDQCGFGGGEPARDRTENQQIKSLLLYHQELLQLARIEGLLVHDLRRSYASIGLSVGVSLSQIGQLLGHTSSQTTARYAFLIDDAAKAAVARIGEAVATPQQQDQPCTPASRLR